MSLILLILIYWKHSITTKVMILPTEPMPVKEKVKRIKLLPLLSHSQVDLYRRLQIYKIDHLKKLRLKMAAERPKHAANWNQYKKKLKVKMLKNKAVCPTFKI